MFSIYEFQKQLQTEKLQPAKIVHQQEVRASPASEYLPAYTKWFKDVAEVAHDATKIASAKLSEFRIMEATKDPSSLYSCSYKKARVIVEEFSRRGAVVSYNVIVGSFVVNVRMLNVNEGPRKEADGEVINKGSFGSIVAGKARNGEFVSKRIAFTKNVRISDSPSWVVKANFFDVRPILVEFAIAKVCSMFGIAPKILTPFGFDVVCYRNCAEFCMERCQPWNLHRQTPDMKQIEKRLKYCLKVMHSLHIVHRDIKPANIIYSPFVGDVVFCDFGISHPVRETPGYKTKTIYMGTPNFMSKEVYELSREKGGYADLYYSDMYSLTVSLEIMSYSILPKQKPRLCAQDNPLCDVFTALHYIAVLRKELEVCVESRPQFGAFADYFPEIGVVGDKRLNRALGKDFDFNFMVASLPLDSTMKKYLLACSSDDAKVKLLCQKMRSYDEGLLQRVSEAALSPKLLERELLCLNEKGDKTLTLKEKFRMGKVAMRLLRVVVIRDPLSSECKSLLELVETLDLKETNSELEESRLMLKVAVADLTPQLFEELHALCRHLSFEALQFLEHIVDRRGFHKPALMILERLLEMSTAYDINFIYYATRIGMLKEQLGLSERKDHLERTISYLKTKKPSEWKLPQVKLAHFIAIQSPKRIQSFLEQALSEVPVEYLGEALYSLSNCYGSSLRMEESVKCLELARALLYRYWGRCSIYEMALSINGTINPRLKTLERFLSAFSNIPHDIISYKDERDSMTLQTDLSFVQVHTILGNFGEATRYLIKVKEILYSSSFPLFPFAVHLWVFYASTFLLYTHTSNIELARQVAQQSLDDFTEYICKHPERLFSDRVGVKIIHFILAWCLLANGKLRSAFEIFESLVGPSFLIQLRDYKASIQQSIESIQTYCITPDRGEQCTAILNAFRVSIKAEETYDQILNIYKQLMLVHLLLMSGDYANAEASITAIEKEFPPNQSLPNRFNLISYLVEECERKGKYNLALRVLEYIPHSLETELQKAICMYALGLWKKCQTTCQRLLESAQQKDLWVAAKCCRLLSDCLFKCCDEVHSDLYLQKEIYCLERLVKVGFLKAQVYHRLAACETASNKKIPEIRLRLLQAAYLALKQRKVEVSLALDCARAFRNTPQKVIVFFKACKSRNPEVLIEYCKCLIALKKKRNLCKVGALLLRNPNAVHETGLLKKILMKEGWTSAIAQILIGKEVPSIISSNEQYHQCGMLTQFKRRKQIKYYLGM